jgi:hypothetical protein
VAAEEIEHRVRVILVAHDDPEIDAVRAHETPEVQFHLLCFDLPLSLGERAARLRGSATREDPGGEHESDYAQAPGTAAVVPVLHRATPRHQLGGGLIV